MFKCARIKNIRSVGVRRTFNIEMASGQHNYITCDEVGQPIHKNSHSCSYILVAYWCAWLKAHFAPEWWSSVMSRCHSDRIPRYMNTARLEGVKFGNIDISNLTRSFSVSKDLKVTPGLISIKGIGDKAANKIAGQHEYADIDEFVYKNGKAKTVIEPLIKLGAFSKLHPNLKATWMWYQYRYCSGKDITKLRKEIRSMLLGGWTDDEINKERKRQADEYFKLYPNRKSIPAKIKNWTPKVDDSRDNVMALYEDDFSLAEILEFEKYYLGYYWHSPLDLYDANLEHTIENVKNSEFGVGYVDGVVEKLIETKTRFDKKMGKLIITDGLSECTIMIWEDQLVSIREFAKEGKGFKFYVVYDNNRYNFTLVKGSLPTPLELK